MAHAPPLEQIPILDIDKWIADCPEKPPSADSVKNKIRSILRPSFNELCETIEHFYADCGLSMETIVKFTTRVSGVLAQQIEPISDKFDDDHVTVCDYEDELKSKINVLTTELNQKPYCFDDHITLLQSCKLLKAKIKDLDEIRSDRMRRLYIYQKQHSQLPTLPDLQTPAPIDVKLGIPSNSELTEFREAMNEYHDEYDRRREEYDKHQRLIKVSSELLELPASTSEQEPDYSESNLGKLRDLLHGLLAQYDRNKLKFTQLRDRLVELFNFIEEPRPEQNLFLDTHAACKPSIIAEIESEVNEYEETLDQLDESWRERLAQSQNRDQPTPTDLPKRKFSNPSTPLNSRRQSRNRYANRSYGSGEGADIAYVARRGFITPSMIRNPIWRVIDIYNDSNGFTILVEFRGIEDKEHRVEHFHLKEFDNGPTAFVQWLNRQGPEYSSKIHLHWRKREFVETMERCHAEAVKAADVANAAKTANAANASAALPSDICG